MSLRPTDEDMEVLDMLLAVEGLPEKSALFCESLYESEGKIWSPGQCKWFDDLCERYL